ncbi:RmlC-like cupin domain-containing protein [Mycena maculata]|uniref:RmlC-like cupin domain-containing protein n=1 Tax=Mycena maculata TaxID=230809 RepID=A0AAD7K7R3_9AGAR|nr:RmlC-like cupin domain-containing protein [Mycena maculata]
MLPRSSLFLLISLLPVYISLAFYFNLIALPPSAQDTLLSLLKLANSNLRRAQLSSRQLSSSVITDSNMTVKIIPRPSQERGHADHDWLKTFHTFSFASYQDNNHSQFGSLRVINEDRVAPRTGFGTHSHREFEIFSYVVAGQLEHKDSMGNIEILKRGDLQLTSAGTGISHSEKAYGPKQVHFLQIWSLPSVSRLQPKYFTRHFTDAQKRDVWARIVAPVDAEGVLKDSREGEGPAPVQSPLTLYATLLSDGKSLKQTIKGSKGYIHVVQTSGYNTNVATGAAIRVIGAPGVEVELKEGDGAYLHFSKSGELTVENIGDKTAEVLLFDLE